MLSFLPNLSELAIGSGPKRSREDEEVALSTWQKTLTRYKVDPTRLGSANRELTQSEFTRAKLKDNDFAYERYRVERAIDEKNRNAEITVGFWGKRIGVTEFYSARPYIIRIRSNFGGTCVEILFDGDTIKLSNLFLYEAQPDCEVHLNARGEIRGYGEFVVDMMTTIAAECAATITVEDAASFSDPRKMPIFAHGEMSMSLYLRIKRDFGLYEKFGFFASNFGMRSDTSIDTEVAQQNRQLKWSHMVANTELSNLTDALTAATVEDNEEWTSLMPNDRYRYLWRDDVIEAAASAQEKLGGASRRYSEDPSTNLPVERLTRLSLRSLLVMIDAHAERFRERALGMAGIATEYAPGESSFSGNDLKRFLNAWKDLLRAERPQLDAELEFIASVAVGHSGLFELGGNYSYKKHVYPRGDGSGLVEHVFCVAGPPDGPAVCVREVVPRGVFTVRQV